MATKAETARANGKKGGRPLGKKNAATLEKEAVLREFKQRVMSTANLLFDAQLTLARGQTFLYKIEKELQIGPKGGKKYVRSKPKLVTEQWEIEAFLEGRLLEDTGFNDESDPSATYYFLTTKEPDNRAVDSLLDRAFGKSMQAVELTGKDGSDLFNNDHRNKAKQAIAGVIGGGDARKGR